MEEYDRSNNMCSQTWFEVAYSAAFSISYFQTKSCQWDSKKYHNSKLSGLSPIPLSLPEVFRQTDSPQRPQLSSQWLFSCVWTPWRPHCIEWWPHRDWNSRFYFQPLSNSCIDDCLFWRMGPDPNAPRITQPRVYFWFFTISITYSQCENVKRIFALENALFQRYNNFPVIKLSSQYASM